MKADKAADLVKLSDSDLGKKLSELSREAFNLRFQRATNQLANTARISVVRKTIARIKTIQNARQQTGE